MKDKSIFFAILMNLATIIVIAVTISHCMFKLHELWHLFTMSAILASHLYSLIDNYFELI